MTRQLVRNIGKSLLFNGTSDKLAITTMGSFGSSFGSGISVAFWFRTQNTSNQCITGFFNTGNTTAMIVNINNPARGKLSIFLRDEGGLVLSGNTDVLGLDNGMFHHAVATANLATNAITFYIDGESKTAINVIPQTPVNFVNLGFVNTVGCRNLRGVYDTFFKGNLAEVIFYNKILTQTEAQGIYYRSAYPSSAVSRYNFNDNVLDQVGSNDGTLTGTVYSTLMPEFNGSRTAV